MFGAQNYATSTLLEAGAMYVLSISHSKFTILEITRVNRLKFKFKLVLEMAGLSIKTSS